MPLLVVRFGEIGLKSRNVRRRFNRTLIDNIERVFINAALDCFVRSEWGRIYIYTDDANKGLEVLSKVFGIVSISEAIETASALNDICEVATELSKNLIGNEQSFAVRARRTGEHSYTSMDVACEVGTAVLSANKLKSISVDLKNPDVEIFVEVRFDKAYIFPERVAGPGGFPIGTQGKVVALLSDDVRSAVAAWLMMKRGCRVLAAYFDTGDVDVKGKVLSYIEILQEWGPSLKTFIIPLKSLNTDKSESLSSSDGLTQNAYGESIKIAIRNRAEAIVTGDTLQTFTDVTIQALPVFYPCIGMSDNEIQKLAQKIGLV